MAVLVLAFQNGFGQNNIKTSIGELKGRIINELNEPVMFGSIALMNTDSTIAQVELSDEDGYYVLPINRTDIYFITIDHLEYESFSSNSIELQNNKIKNFNEIVLKKATVNLDELVITGRKKLIELQADKIVFNVSASPSAAGSNGLDLLRKAPGVTIDMDNNISLQGKPGVLIYINGNPSRLSGNDLTILLQNMTADNIEAIEIIANPSARYEAEGNAGIINIRLKKNVTQGFNSNINTNINKGKYYRKSAGLSFNLGLKKINSSFDITASDDTNQDDFIDTKDQSGFFLDQKSFEVKDRQGMNIGLGIDAQLNQKNTLNFSARSVLNQSDNQLNSTTTIDHLTTSQPRQILKSGAFQLSPSRNHNLNLNHKFQQNEKSFLSSDVSFGQFSNSRANNQPNTIFEDDGTSILEVDDKAFDAKTSIGLWSFKTDYEKTLENIQLSLGGKYAHIQTNNQFDYFDVESGVKFLDVERSNDFSYSEDVAALYGIFMWKIDDILTLNAGIRMETTFSRGVLNTDQPIFDKDVVRKYTDFFPNVSLAFNNQKNHSFSLGIGRRITRPNYQDLNPFESPVSQLVRWKGNPFLTPNYIMNYQLSYAYKQKLTFTSLYSITRDFFATILEIDGDKGNLIIPRNMEKSTNIGLSLSYPLEVTPYWELVSFVNGSYRTYEGNLEGTVIDLAITTYDFRIQNHLKLPFGITMDLSYYLGSNWIWRGSIVVQGNHNLGFGIRKEFLDKKLMVVFTGTDVFRTDSDYFYRGEYGGLIIDGIRTFDNRRFGLSMVYKFGNQQLKLKKKSKSALDDEMDRINQSGG
ncbi:MAG: TonB-dependent receptor [Saprospiraceae bacterium]